MKQIVNIIIMGVVLFGASKIFPDVVQISGMGPLVLTILLLSAISLSLVLLYIAALKRIMISLLFNEEWKTMMAVMTVVIVWILLVMASYIIGLSIASREISGMEVKGLRARIVLSFALMLIRIPDNATHHNVRNHNYNDIGMP